MSIPLIVTRGFGNGSLVGSIKDVVTAGYDIGIPVIITPDCFQNFSGPIEEFTSRDGFIGAVELNLQGIIDENTDLNGFLCC